MLKEPVKEKIALDQKIGKQTTQVLLEGDIIVPDTKPDMAIMLQADASAAIERAEGLNDRVNFMGRLDIQVLYLARGSSSPVHSMAVTTSIDDFINMDGVSREVWVDAKAHIANIDYKMINDRKINYRAIVDVSVFAESTDEHDIVVDLEDVPGNQLLKSSVNLNRTIECKSDRFVTKDDFTIEPGKPNIREILQTNVTIANKDARVSNGRVNINGDLIIKVLYKGDNESSLIEMSEHEIPFSGGIDATTARDDMYADVSLSVIDQYIQVKADADGEDRSIDAEITINAAVKIGCGQTIEILEDAYCINKVLNITKNPINYSKLICHNRNQSPVKEIVTLADECPDILQIFSVTGRPYVHEIKIVDDKTIVEGSIDANVLYIAQSDEAPLFSYKTVAPFRQVIETKGAVDGMDVSLDAGIEHVSFNMLSGREMELRFLLSFNTSVYKEKEMNIITDIQAEELDKSVLEGMASMTIYVVQKGDDLWKIAKKYNTSIDDLLAVNEIETPSRVLPGQKLLILKKVE